MGIHAQPKPLDEPLRGGTEGATVSVEPMIGGYVHFPLAFFEKAEGPLWKLKMLGLPRRQDKWLAVPCPAFLIRHPSAGAILVDTALHTAVSSDPSSNLGAIMNWYAKPILEPGTDVASQLRAKGVNTSQVSVVVMTHLHFDHSSAIAEFPQSTFVVSEPEWIAAASGRNQLANGYRRAHIDYAFDYRTIDYGGEGIDSYASFGRTFDLFGDGSIRLAFTPGHSAGHQSVIAHLGDRDFVIGGDAVYTERQLDGGPPPPNPDDRHNWRRSLQELTLFRREYPQAVITPGHDPAFYERIEERYE